MTQKGFYQDIPREGKAYLGFDGAYHVQKVELEKWPLALRTAGKKPVFASDVARLWDIEDGVACFEVTMKMGLMNEHLLELLERSLDIVEADFHGFVIGHDGKHFSAGMDLHVVQECAAAQDWRRLESLLKQGQACMRRIREIRAPVIAAISGYTLGGGCELTMHCAAAQAHSQTKMGLIETDIGVIPGWGGLAAHLIRAAASGGGNIEAVTQYALCAFRQVAGARKSANAEGAFAMKLLQPPSRITYNRERLLPDAKELCREVSMTRTPHPQQGIEVPVDALYAAFLRRK